MRICWALLFSLPVLAQTTPDESFKPYTDAPRLLLRPARLRLLTRERERQSIRFQQFSAYITNGAALPEPAFALALATRISGDPAHCNNAYAWVLKYPEARQRAIVLDWCSAQLTEAQQRKLIQPIPPISNIASLRDRAFLALAASDLEPALAEATLKQTVQHWRTNIAPGLRTSTAIPQDQLYPLLELLHVVRDNLEIDLRQGSPQYFIDLPLAQMLGYYPAPYPGPENEFRIAFFSGDGEPDLKLATMLRAAELAVVSLDNNAELSQSLQGWLMQDRYLLRSGLGIPYEFLWANPYQPGLTYHHLANSLHDTRNGRLFIRNNWEEEARFLCYYDGKIQLFEDGKRKMLKVSPNTPSIEMGDATILVGGHDLIKPIQFELHGAPREAWYVIGLKPNTLFDVEVDDEELDEASTDSGGILSLDFTKATAKTGVRIFPARLVKGSD